MTEAVFDNFIALGNFVLLPVAKFLGGRFDGLGDFFNLSVGERVVVNLVPVLFLDVITIVLGPLCDEEV